MRYFFILTILLGLQACDRPGQLATPASIDDAANFTLTIDTSNIAADSMTYGDITVTLAGPIKERYKEINLDISPEGKFSNGNTTIKLLTDATGKAHAFVYSNVQALSYVRAVVGDYTRTIPITFIKTTADTLVLSVTKDNVAADNYTYAEITAITKKRPFTNNQIVFVADRGTFTNNSNTLTIQASLNDTTKAYLKYNKAEKIRITATIYNSYTKEVYASFMPSLPSQVLVYPDVSTFAPVLTSKSTITAKLLRVSGTVSEGQIVQYSDSAGRSSGGSLGTFINTSLSNSDGESVATYWLQDTSFHGFVYIKAAINVDSGKVVKGMNRILIQ